MKMKENKILGMIPVTVFSGEEEGETNTWTFWRFRLIFIIFFK